MYMCHTNVSDVRDPSDLQKYTHYSGLFLITIIFILIDNLRRSS